MKTFILLTFGFLGFAFYEMSGGAEFEPASARVAKAAPKVAEAKQIVEATPKTGSSAINTASITKIDSTPNVTRASLNLADASEATAQATQQIAAAATAKVIDSADTPQIILPSLIATTNTRPSSDGDVRVVSGNRVNVRGGPSTNYGIVSKLTRGIEVRILEDNGDGWVRMQPLDGGEAGWMADFLLTSG
ncbi:SH3 domain-containing protein [Sulfitobacter sp.]|uniref:SH3 domain-containing protein n=1 Tax=Sulfitobacter sp. TaxID=1903071 RepID=UPI0030037F62